MKFLVALGLFTIVTCGLILWLDSVRNELLRLKRRDLEHRAARLRRAGLRAARDARDCAAYGLRKSFHTANQQAQACFRESEALQEKLRSLGLD